MKVFPDSGGCERVGWSRVEDGFDGGAAFGAEFLTIVGAAFEDFDAIVGVGIMAGGDVDGKIEAHLIETVVDSWGGEDAGAHIFDAERFEGLA